MLVSIVRVGVSERASLVMMLTCISMDGDVEIKILLQPKPSRLRN